MVKKIRCDVDSDDWVRGEISSNGEHVRVTMAGNEALLTVILTPSDARKLRKQLKKALLQIEGVKKAEGDWFSPGKKVVITGNSNCHEFPIGTIAIIRENELNDEKSKHCEYLDGHDYWFIYQSDCKPYKEDEA